MCYPSLQALAGHDWRDREHFVASRTARTPQPCLAASGTAPYARHTRRCTARLPPAVPAAAGSAAAPHRTTAATMMGGPPGAGPGVNDLVVPHATLKVSNIPSFVTQSDFSRLMTQLEGCVDARLLGRCARFAVFRL